MNSEENSSPIFYRLYSRYIYIILELGCGRPDCVIIRPRAVRRTNCEPRLSILVCVYCTGVRTIHTNTRLLVISIEVSSTHSNTRQLELNRNTFVDSLKRNPRIRPYLHKLYRYVIYTLFRYICYTYFNLSFPICVCETKYTPKVRTRRLNRLFETSYIINF